jgi:hypothetical protein
MMPTRRVHLPTLLVWGCFLLLLCTLVPPTGWGQTRDVALDMAILLDRSGSMGGPRGNDPRGLSKPAALYLVDQVDLSGSQNRVVLVPFATKVQTLPSEGLTNRFDQVRKAIADIPAPTGYTDLEAALNTAYKLLRPFDDGHKKQVVIITDGIPEPDPGNLDRYPDIARQLQAQTQGVAHGSERYRQIVQRLQQTVRDKSRDTIETVLLPQFAKRIEVYPIGLSEAGVNKDFLSRIALTTTRNQEGFKIVKESLIADVEAIVPKPENIFTIYRTAAQDTQGQARFEREVAIGSHISRVRFFVNYRVQDTRWKDMQVTLVAPDGGTMTRDNPGAAHYLGARDRDGQGNLVFERFFFDRPASGTWKLSIASGSGTVLLPPLDIIVEGQTELRLRVDANPQQVQEGASTVFLTSATGTTGLAYPLVAAEGELRGPQGVIGTLAFAASATAGGMRSEWAPGAGATGEYWVLVRGFFDPDKQQWLSGRTSFTVIPPEPITLRIDIPFGAAPKVP